MSSNAAQFHALVVGFTGGIGSGKSTVANLFADRHQVTVIDADQVARDVVAPNEPAYQAIHHRFGDAVLLENGELNRAWLRQQVFSDAAAKAWLNALMHPLIRQRLLDQLAAVQQDYVLLMAPLLLENQLQHYCDMVVVVDVSEQTQEQRASARDQNSAEQIRAVMAAQLDRATRIAAADIIIDNELPLDSLPDRVAAIHQQLTHAAKCKQQRIGAK